MTVKIEILLGYIMIIIKKTSVTGFIFMNFLYFVAVRKEW